MKSKVKYVEILSAEGTHEYASQFPKRFESFKEVNKFFLENMENYSKGGYCKHNVSVEWENGKKYEYRADMSHREGDCFYSVEYSVGARIKQGLLHFLENYKSNKECEEWVQGVKEILETCETSSFDSETFEWIMKRDEKIRKENRERHDREFYDLEYSEMLKSHEESNKRIIVSLGVRYGHRDGKYGFCAKSNIIQWTGNGSSIHKYTKEKSEVTYARRFEKGDDARISYHEYGKVEKVTNKSVIMISDSGKRRIVTHQDFINYNNRFCTMTESERQHQAYYEAYSR